MNIFNIKKISLYLMIIMLNFKCSNKVKTDNYEFDLKYPNHLNIILQKDWGGTENQSSIQKHKIDRITLHHGGVEFTEDKDPEEYLQNLQSWSRSEKNWMDIPYHFLIDLNGIIYEGRSTEYPGDTNTNYDPTGHLLICLMGNYEIQKVNLEQFESIVNVVSLFIDHFDIEFEKIKGHKDYAETTCPGKDFYAYLENGSLLNAVEKNMQINVKLPGGK